ncbi:hypothetical protein COOONC_10677 [Cooperia oncophora]
MDSDKKWAFFDFHKTKSHLKASPERVISLAAVELAACGLAFIGFCTLRRSEKSRQYLYQHFPRISKAYYWAEDSISFGQLIVNMVKESDILFAKMMLGLFAATLGGYIYEQWKAQQPSPDIPVQAWDKYVEIQKKSGREI